MRHRENYSFSRVPAAEIQRSVFDRSHGHKTTFDAGWLVPFYVDEALPGDTFRVSAHMLGRLATPLFALMDNIYLDVFFFAVPNRLLWTNWVKFMGEQVNPGDSTSYLVPVVTDPVCTVGSLGNYLGIPYTAAGVDVNALPFRAYNAIFNTWFRDQNLVNSVAVPLTDGPDAAGNYTLLRRGKRHDYFTSCLPFPQKGTAVSLPLGTTAAVKAFDQTSALGMLAVGDAVTQRDLLGQNASSLVKTTGAAFGADRNLTLDNSKAGAAGGLYTDLTNASAASINAIRQAVAVQRLLERDARGGTRYPEIIQAHWRVTNPDFRMQRPEYLGGGTYPVVIHPVSSTNGQVTGFPGKQFGFGTVSVGGCGFTKSFTEHCVVMGLMQARADLTYQQGVERQWWRQTKYDYFWPELAHLGEQSVLNREIYAKNDGNDGLVFGYQERYAEYRYFPSRVSGQFQSSNPTGDLDGWHLAIEFSALPALNAAFINDDPPIDRVIATQSDPHFILDSWLTISAARAMPTYSVPGLTRF